MDEAGVRTRSAHRVSSERQVRRHGRMHAPPPLGTDCALFLDIDGTLIEFAPTPDAVRVDAHVRSLVPALVHALGGAVALITGRTIADADRLFPGLTLPIAGQHGCERRAVDGTIHRGRPPRGLTPLRRAVERFAARHDGLLVEDKGSTLAVHYRLAPRLAPLVHRTLRAELAVHGDGWRLQRGNRVVEIRPEGRDKGRAIFEFMDETPFRERIPVFVGDDQTDEWGFAAVDQRGGWAVKVGRHHTRARYRLPDVDAVRRWLGAAVAAAGRATTSG